MENTKLYRVGTRRRNGSTWRNHTVDNIISRSSRDEDDEEALNWASLEKLPTYDRIKKGILSGSTGGFKEIDVQNLGVQERKTLLERLVRIAGENNEKFLLKLKNRMNQVGIESPTIEIRFENLNIEAQAYFGSRSLPSVLNFVYDFVEGVLNSFRITRSKKQPVTILHGINGIIKPHRMTLLLGPPGAGKTTLLLSLAGKLDKDLKRNIRLREE